MADLESLNIKSITEMTTDEGLEHLRQIRLSRRTPTKTKKVSKKTAAKKDHATAINRMTPEEAAQLLSLLEE